MAANTPCKPHRPRTQRLRLAEELYAGLLRLVLVLSVATSFAASAWLLWPVCPWLVFAVPALIAGNLWRSRGTATSGSYGTAAWAGRAQLKRGGLLGESGLVLGRVSSGKGQHPAWGFLTAPRGEVAPALRRFVSKSPLGELIRLERFVHLCTVAPSGKGKGVGYVVPNLLSYPHSAVCFDPKGENKRLTARHRERAFGHRIVHLNFWNVDGTGSDQLNPLDLIDFSRADAVDLCRALGEAMVVRTAEEKDPHFTDSAANVIATAIAFVCRFAEAKDRNLQTVRDIVVNPQALANAVIELGKDDDPLLKRLAHGVSHYRDRELGSVLSTTNRFTAWLDSAAASTHMRATSFDLFALRRTGRVTVYITLPEDKLSTNIGLLRLINGTLLRAVTGDGVSRREPKVLFLLDEAKLLGRMKELQDALTLYRGYGVATWWFFQSPEQVKACFEHESEFWDNTDAQMFFGLRGFKSTEELSKRLGEATERVLSHQENTSVSGGRGASVGEPRQQPQFTRGRSVTASEMARHLLKPDEIGRLSDDAVLIFAGNLPPILARLVRYFDAPEFQGGRAGLPAPLGARALMAVLPFALGAAVIAYRAYAVAHGS